jgi:membrane protein implicated in regulation of membrane protease activity
VKSGRVWLVYSLLRLALFVVPFALLMVAGVAWYWAAIIAAIISLCASYIFLGRQRQTMAEDLSAIQRGRKRPIEDNTVEDAAVDRQSPTD